MPKIRMDDLLRHFVGEAAPVVAAHQERKRTAAKERDTLQREERKLAMEELLRKSAADRQAADDRRELDDRNAEHARQTTADSAAEYERNNPWVYQGNRYASEGEMEAAIRRRETIGAQVTAAHRAPDTGSDTDDGPNWQVIQTADGLLQINPKTGATRPVQTGTGTAQPRSPAGGAAASAVAQSRDALAAMEELALNPSPSGDLALKTLYMKILDPASVVREGELEMLNNAGSFADQISARAESASSGLLTEARRNDMLKQARAVVSARTGGGSPPAPAVPSAARPSVEARVAQLKAQGKSMTEARAIMQAEGYFR